MAKKEQIVIYLKGGEKLFADTILKDDEKGIVFKKESKGGRECQVTVPATSVAYVEKWGSEE